MKKAILALGLFMCIGWMSATAQTKFGYVNSEEIIAAMPETKAMNDQLDMRQKALEAQGQKLLLEYQKKKADLDSNYNSLPEAIRNTLEADLNETAAKIQSFQDDAQSELSDLQDKLVAPIIEKAKTAVKAVAAEKGYDYVFDLSTSGLVVYPPGDDLTKAVKLKLGLPN